MTDEEKIAQTYDRAELLRSQITTAAQEMFGHLAALGVPPTLMLLLPDGEHTMHDLARAREAARRELGEITTELRVRERQLAHVKMQRSPIELETLDDIEAGCCARIVGGAVGLQKRAQGRLIVIDPVSGEMFFAGVPQ